jgi:ferrochelatase
MAYGTPSKPEDVEPYYTHIRHGRKPSAGEVENLKARYSSIGGRTPLLEITQSTARKLSLALSSREIKVYAGMKHWHPYISEVVPEIVSEGNTELLSIALAPHYSKMSIGSYEEAVKEANNGIGGKLGLEFVESWHLNSVFIDKWCERILDARNKYFGSESDNVFHLFTAHSLPEKILTWKDPYKEQLLATTSSIVKHLGIADSHFGFCFQSAGHTSEPWLGPDILDKLKDLAGDGHGKILVAPIGFVSDHLEILFDIDAEAQSMARRLGIKLARTESFNDSDDFISVLCSVVEESGFL